MCKDGPLFVYLPGHEAATGLPLRGKFGEDRFRLMTEICLASAELDVGHRLQPHRHSHTPFNAAPALELPGDGAIARRRSFPATAAHVA